jgi:hypothetical protein
MDDYSHGRRELLACILPPIGAGNVQEAMREVVGVFGQGAPLFPAYRLEEDGPHVWYIFTHSFSAPMIRNELEKRLPGTQIFVGELRPLDPDQPSSFAWAKSDATVMHDLGRAAYAFDGEAFPGAPPGTPFSA